MKEYRLFFHLEFLMQRLDIKSLDTGAVVTKALVNAKAYFKLSNAELAKIIGGSEATISRLMKGTRIVDLDSKEGELAILFLRVFRSLDSWMGGHLDNSMAWLRAHHHILKGTPLNLMQRVDGLNRVVEYLDAIRGHG